MRQGILNFPFFSMQLKNEDRTHPNVIGPIINPVDTILQRGKRTTIWVKSQIYTENEGTGIIQPLHFWMMMKIFVFVQQFRQPKIINIWSKLAIF